MAEFSMDVRLSQFQSMAILQTNISQRSVATSLRKDGIFNYLFSDNLPLSLSVKEFWKLVNIW